MAQITKVGPVKNMETDEVVNLGGPRVTRSDLHILLNNHNIPHDMSMPFDMLNQLCIINNIPVTKAKPGEHLKLVDPVKQEDSSAVDLMAVIKEQQKQIDQLLRQGIKAVDIPKKKTDGKPRISADGWPMSVFTLRKWCKERNIECKKTNK